MKYANILRAIESTAWAIQPEKLQEIVGVVEAREMGVSISAQDLQAYSQQKKKYAGIDGGVMVLPVYGTIAQRIGLMNASGGTSTDELSRDFEDAINSDAVGAILFDVDSPGGSVAGVQELADQIAMSRGQKPIIAIANAKAGSAAYWIAASCDELIVTPSADIGSIGVFSVHVDYSKQNEAEGLDVTYVSAGPYKIEGNRDSPLSKEAFDYEQSRINEFYDSFVNGVARGRGVSTGTVKASFGQGRTVGARTAVKLGMADRVAPLRQVVAELNAGRNVSRGARTRRVQSADMMKKRLMVAKLKLRSMDATAPAPASPPRFGSREWIQAERKKRAALKGQ